MANSRLTRVTELLDQVAHDESHCMPALQELTCSAREQVIGIRICQRSIKPRHARK